MIIEFVTKKGSATTKQLVELVQKKYPELTEHNIAGNGLWRMRNQGLISMFEKGIYTPAGKPKKQAAYKDRKENKQNDIEEDVFDEKKHVDTSKLEIY